MVLPTARPWLPATLIDSSTSEYSSQYAMAVTYVPVLDTLGRAAHNLREHRNVTYPRS
jgi:2-C-methyl-D-erythritol 4-phosphate cytidylyltransferase